MIMECKNCKWVDGRKCKRYPPKIFDIKVFEDKFGKEERKYIEVSPRVNENDFCGEFSPK